jgi:DCN1-like protein 1/2
MDMNGLMRYLEVLSLTPEDAKVLCLCHLLNSPRLGVLERREFLKHWTALLVPAASSSSPPSIQSLEEMVKFQTCTLADLDRRLRSEFSYFEQVYRYTFDFGRDEGQKSLGPFSRPIINLYIYLRSPPPPPPPPPPVLTHIRV